MNLISIDPSKRSTGIFWIIGNESGSETLVNKSRASDQEVYRSIFDYFDNFLMGKRIDLGLIEDYAYAMTSYRGQVLLHEIGGIIRLVFARHEIPLVPVCIPTWKSLTVRKADKKKVDEYLKLVEKMYGKVFPNTDEADAFLIYQAVSQIVKNPGRSEAAINLRKRILEIIDRRNDGNKKAM